MSSCIKRLYENAHKHQTVGLACGGKFTADSVAVTKEAIP